MFLEMADSMLKIRADSAALRSVLALLVGVMAMFAAQPAFAQAPADGVVQRIRVEGNERVEQSTVVSYLSFQPGDTSDPAKRDLAVKVLFRTGLFSDVEVAYLAGELVVTVVENPIINRVIFEGNSNLKEDKLRDEVTVRPRRTFTRARAHADVQRLVELYRKSGRISATVTPQIVELPQKRVDLIFKIDEGPKSGILSVNFLGNRAFSDSDLRDVVLTTQSRWYKLFSSNANYDPDRLEYDREQLRIHYRNRGYYDFRVSSVVAELALDKNGFVVTYTLDEGQRYRFGEVSVETQLQRLDKGILEALVPIRSGQVYQDGAIEEATDALTFAAGAAGFAFVDVRPVYQSDRESGTIDLVFEIDEGPRVYVDRIDIVGNSQTLDYVIRREMSVVEGDAYNRALVDRSRRQISSLRFFGEVEITEQPGSAPDRTALQVEVEEQATGQLSFAGGYSSVDQLIVELGISQLNFRGRGQEARANVSLGSRRKQLDFSFTEPRFLGRDLAAGIDLYAFSYDLSDVSFYDTVTYGTTFRTSFPLSLNARGSLRYVLRQEEINVAGDACNLENPVLSSGLCDQAGKSITSLVGYGASLDRRNDYLNPSRGFIVGFLQDLAGIGGQVKFVSTSIFANWYHGLSRQFVFSLSGTAGHVRGWGGDDVRFNDRFFKGGGSFRGFEIAGIGPRDTTFGGSGALGGELYVLGTAELTFPTFLPDQYGIKTAVFADVGTLGKLNKDDKLYRQGDLDCLNPFITDPMNPIATISNPAVPGTRNVCVRDDLSLRAAAGLSIFWRSPMGPIRFDFSRILAREPYDRVERFQFTQTTRF